MKPTTSTARPLPGWLLLAVLAAVLLALAGRARADFQAGALSATFGLSSDRGTADNNISAGETVQVLVQAVFDESAAPLASVVFAVDVPPGVDFVSASLGGRGAPAIG
ncbi:MAG TPA: hypothetical protein VHF22_00435, partial [Planctomycetota bacterium]|nr:hypothetical protein [Planctomycetota bacterium]